jgi:4'-phosphopantetheinyl transferase
MTLFAVVMPIEEADHSLPGKDRVERLSKLAREALRVSAEKSGVVLGEMRKDADDVPCQCHGYYWSVSHKPKCVAGVVGAERIGIDLEEVKPRDEGLFRLVASDEEWTMVGKSWANFFRYWTAKEAVLKAAGIGIGGLKGCAVAAVPDDRNVLLRYEGQMYAVEQMYYNSHIISVLKNDNRVDWIVAESPGNCVAAEMSHG